MNLARGWIDTAGRCRTWRLLDKDGNLLAEITTKRGAERLLVLLKGQTP